MSSKDPLSITLLKKASLANKNRKNGVSIKQFLASSKSLDSDDSFDLCLPVAVKKVPEPCVSNPPKENTQKQCPVCLGTFSNVKRHLQHCAKKHKLSDTSLAEALQLQRDYADQRKGLGLPSLETENGEGPKPKKGKLKLSGKHLLLKRTQEERTNIIMEKVGILLAQEEDQVEFKAGDVEVGSSFLQEIVDKESKLWEKAKRSEGSISEFYVEPIRPFVAIESPVPTPDQPPERPTSSLSQASTEIASPEVVCISSSQESSLERKPSQEARSSPDIEVIEVSPKPCSPVPNIEDESTRLSSPMKAAASVRSPSSVLDGIADESTRSPVLEGDREKCVRSPSLVRDGIVDESTRSPIVEGTTEKCVTSSPSGVVNDSKRSPSPFFEQPFYEGPEFHEAPAESTRIETTLEFDRAQLSNILRTQLAEDWGTFVGGAYKSDIEVKLEDGSFYTHSIILFVRCPVLLSETHKTKTLEWPTVPLKVCEAFFSFLYAAEIEKISKLTWDHVQILRELCTKYKVCGLEELFEHLEPKRHSLKRRTSEDLFGSPKKRRSSPELVDLTACSPDIMASGPTSPVELVNDPDNEEGHKTLTFEDDDEIVQLSQNRKRSSFNVLEETLNYNEGVIHFSPEIEPSTSKKSIDKYFQESFPDIIEIEPRTPSPAIIPSRTTSQGSKGINTEFRTPSPAVVPSRSTPQDSKGVNTEFRTPSPSIIVSDTVTPQLDYSNLLSPELQSELRKYGLKPGIERRKAKMLLRYIYDQIHPVIPQGASSTEALEGQADSESSSSSEVSEDYVGSSDTEEEDPISHKKDYDSIRQAVISFIKADDTLYDALLRFTPIWLDEFQQGLKEKGIKCSKNLLKDILDAECVAYRTKRKEGGRRRRKQPKRGRGRELRL